MTKILVSFLLAFSVTSSFAQDRICAMGDWGTGSDDQKKVARAMNDYGCNHIILLGDNFYERGVDSVYDSKWQDYFENIYRDLLDQGAYFFVSLGNHDYKGSPEAQVEYSRINPQWILPSRFYAYKWGEDCFFALDTNERFEEQAEWLQSLLTNNYCRHRIAFGHHPIISSGRHGNDSGEVNEYIRPALSGVELYLAGHDHHFSDEGNVLTNSRDSESPSFRQLVVGTGGASPRTGACQSGGDCRFFAAEYGFVALDLLEDRIEFSFFTKRGDRLYSSTVWSM